HGDGMPRTLSGGQQQRVALARTLAPRPKLVLLDEPLAALDRPLRHEIGTELRQAHQLVGTPMILVTHDPDEAERIADRVIRISGGRME
ncbi:MAG: ATP-binding cassette domain-containing protein, partial [Gemmatimonas sp.]